VRDSLALDQQLTGFEVLALVDVEQPCALQQRRSFWGAGPGHSVLLDGGAAAPFPYSASDIIVGEWAMTWARRRCDWSAKGRSRGAPSIGPRRATRSLRRCTTGSNERYSS